MTTLIREAASRCFFLLIPDPTVPMVVAGPRSKNRYEDYLPQGSSTLQMASNVTSQTIKRFDLSMGSMGILRQLAVR